jgi:endonuclease/exonuclease/phosphatase family metal-dependent hydrolase
VLLSVASYNIHQAMDTDGKRDRRRILRVLRDLNADIIGLQEVEGHEMFQLDYLARESGLNAVAGPTMRRQDKDFGNVLLTRHKVLEVRRVDISVSGGNRGALSMSIWQLAASPRESS